MTEPVLLIAEAFLFQMNTYAEKLKDPRWQRKRLEVLNRDKFTCQLCSDKDTELQIHHKEYQKGKEPWEHDDSLLVTLCKDCHGFVSAYKVLPFKIIKRVDKKINQVFICVMNQYSDGLMILLNNEIVANFKLDTTKEIIQLVINYWLSQGMDHNLTDKTIHNA